MPTPMKPARLVRWAPRGKRKRWYIFARDPDTGKQIRHLCAEHGTTNAEDRKELLNQYRQRETLARAENLKRGGSVAYDSLLLDEIKAYEDYLDEAVESREANPEAGTGISPKTREVYKNTLSKLKNWLKKKGHQKLTTGNLSSNLLTQFFRQLSSSDVQFGKRKKKPSAASVNQARRVVRTFVRSVNSKRPRRFPDITEFNAAFAPHENEAKAQWMALTPSDLESFLIAALRREAPDFRADITRARRNGAAVESFHQTAPSTAATPISRLFLVLALCGCRREEALRMKWEHVDLEKGRITFPHGLKRSKYRILPLADDTAGLVAPAFLKLLKCWRDEDPKRKYVLPHENVKQPRYCSSAWRKTNELAGIGRISPQQLRKSFTSYAGACGIAAADSAFWQGHGLAVASKHYRAQVLERRRGDSLESAMGLKPIVEQLVHGGSPV
ncbi:MAG: site-specific integrase [Planctomycetes bacterium]|nr:site-specific integrase [Planctomycetota bacterium]